MRSAQRLLVIISLLFGLSSQLQAVEIRSDARVELCSLVFYLAGSPEYSSCRIPSYLESVKKRFDGFKKHDLIPFIQKIRKERGISYDAVMSAAVAFKSIDSIKPLIDLNTRITEIDKRWTKENLERFYELLADFATKSDFQAFFQENHEFYQATEASVKSLLDQHHFQSWFNTSFPDFKSDFVFIPAYLNGPSCYGPGLTIDGKSFSFCIMGVSKVNDAGKPVFSESSVETIFHEFCHSHTNPLVEKNYAGIADSMKKLFEFGKEEFSRQAYGFPQTVLAESLVRGCSGVFLKERFPVAKYESFIRSQEDRHFFWIRPLSDLIFEMRKNNVSMEKGFPQIMTFFKDYAANAEQHIGKIKARWNDEEKLLKEKSPKIIASTIKDGDTNVATDIATLTITFDRKMKDRCWAIVDAPDMPETPGKCFYDKSGKVFSLPVKLQPEKTYSIQLNSRKFDGFADNEGNQLFPTNIRFSTRKMTEDEAREIEKMRPRVVRFSPANNAKNVPSTTNQLIIEFSQPMKKSWSLVNSEESYPEINGELSFDETQKILTVPVTLKPAQHYLMLINSDKFKSFVGENGLVVTPTKYEFETAK